MGLFQGVLHLGSQGDVIQVLMTKKGTLCEATSGRAWLGSPVKVEVREGNVTVPYKHF